MTTHSPERLQFNANKAALIHLVGKKALDDSTIDRLGHKLFASWGGCFPSDRVKLMPYHYYVINTDPHDKPGIHWLGVFTTKGCAYIWDSFGRPVKPLSYQLIKTIHKRGFKIGKTDLAHHGEQIGFKSEVCGQDSLAFLLVIRDLGITRARNI